MCLEPTRRIGFGTFWVKPTLPWCSSALVPSVLGSLRRRWMLCFRFLTRLVKMSQLEDVGGD
jgi:hypothetical protein